MEIVGTGLVTEIGDTATGFAVLGGIVGGLHFEFADSVGAGAEFIQAAAAEVVTADGDAVN